ncbi:MAG: DnaJ domain-containing protein [Alphaproteobacteria bacterium]|nr:DnaJ domain-containing protein [Alphaproteobacteria bacterium]
MLKRRRQSKYFAPQNENNTHVCDYPGCQKAGEYRAPKNKNLKEYYWFCLEHVQEYNAKWNYYADEFSETEAEDSRRKFRFSSHIKYDFGFDFDFGYNIFDGVSYDKSMSPSIRLTADERNCLKILEIDIEELTVETLKKNYKKAVKKYHPDLNRNNTEAEEIFKIISTGYKSLIAKLS